MPKLKRRQCIEEIFKWPKLSEDLKLEHGFKIIGSKPYFENKTR